MLLGETGIQTVWHIGRGCQLENNQDSAVCLQLLQHKGFLHPEGLFVLFLETLLCSRRALEEDVRASMFARIQCFLPLPSHDYEDYYRGVHQISFFLKN